MRHIDPLTFNGIRFALGAVALLPLLAWQNRVRTGPAPSRGAVVRGGLWAGLFIFCGATLQQYGVVYTTAGKAGFITGLYVLLVPLFGLVLGQRAGWNLWSGAVLAAGGLYLLSATGLTSIELGDGLVLLGTVFWACHVLMVGHLVRTLPAVTIAVAQFVVCSLLSLAGALVFESISWQPVKAALVPILYAGLMSVGVAYTLQVVGQRKARPAHAAIILSMESVFAVLGGWLLLSEALTIRQGAGCLLMLGGILLAQFEFKKNRTFG
jgi:drug/metabolite transporter (DMT)-like permease